MSMRHDTTGTWLATVLTALALAGCSVIDDNLDDCGTDYELDYELRLVTNMTTELQTQLTAQIDVSVAAALRQQLSGIFTDHAHEVDLSFYDTEADSARLHHDEHIMDANQTSYTLYLPMRRYMHLAVANVADNAVVELRGDEQCHTSCLGIATARQDTIASHTTGLFTARQPMEVLSGVDQTFNVRLYMANCASALVIDPRQHDVRSISVFTTGFATQFNISDSTYVFKDASPVVRADRIDTNGNAQLAFCSVSFPSRELLPTRTVIETTDPFVSNTADEALWEIHVYVTLADGSTTRTVLGVREPLRAGQLKVLKGYLDSDGGVQTDDLAVGVSVTLNWNEGGHYEPEL